MEAELCRACLAPQGKIKYSSIFTDNGKIAKEIYKLTNLIIFDLTDINSSAVICQRCLMDLERAISFRELVIRSDDHFRESCNTAVNEIIQNLVKEVKSESNFESLDRSKTEKCSDIPQNHQVLLESNDKSIQTEKDTSHLQSIVKLEQFEVKCVKNSKNNEESSLVESSNQQSASLSYDSINNNQNSDNSPQKSNKIRQKTTQMRPKLDEDSLNLEEMPKLNHYAQNLSKLKLNGPELSHNELKSRQTIENLSQSAGDLLQKLEDSDNGEDVNAFHDNSDLYQFDNLYLNLKDSFQIKDITPYSIDSIKHEQIQDNHIEISHQESPNPKKRRMIPDYVYQELDSNELKCHICSKTFSKRCYLTQHFQTIHMTFKAHRCKKCGKKYASIEELSQHEEKHVADKPFKCSCCPKAFIHKSDLKRHEISHSVRKPYQCTFCDRGFVRNDHLLKHERVHQRKIEKGSNLKVKNLANINEVFGF
ncbi:putative zinc finger protein 286B [Chironomus tepperi]|uniref:putative zinc finger protein 286B n=1 Tax=Chironomus tepperi TaxID=113505 RepID=UPI00391F0B3C